MTSQSPLNRKNGSTVTTTVFIQFSPNFAYGILSSFLGLGLHFSNLRHQLLVEMTVEKKPVKAKSDKNSTFTRFIALSRRLRPGTTFVSIKSFLPIDYERMDGS